MSVTFITRKAPVLRRVTCPACGHKVYRYDRKETLFDLEGLEVNESVECRGGRIMRPMAKMVAEFHRHACVQAVKR